MTDPRSEAFADLREALDEARIRYRDSFAEIVARGEGLDDTAFCGAARAWKRERDQAWRDHRQRIAEIRRAEREA